MMIIMEVMMMMQVIWIEGMISLDNWCWMIGLYDWWMHHSFHHSWQHHWLDNVMRYTVHHRGALMRDGSRHMYDFGHMKWLNVVQEWILRIVVVVAMEIARTCSG